MKLLMFGMSSYPGGTENYIRNIFFHHDIGAELQIDFITYEADLAYSDEMEAFGYRVLRVPHLKRHPIGYFKAVSRIMKEGYDAVYVNMLCAANPLPVYFAKKHKTPHVILHAHSNSTVKHVLRELMHKCFRKYCDTAATLRLACSQAAAQWLFDERNSSSPIHMIPNAIDPEKYSLSPSHRTDIRSRYGVGEDELLLGSVGRLAPEKNNLFMLHILRELTDKGVPAKLMLVGDGGMRPVIEQTIEQLGLSGRVILTGTIIDPYAYYSAFDRFLFPSSFEGFGISALEAQSCGLPCYCSDALSRELDVTHTVRYLPVSAGAEAWAQQLISDATCPPAQEMNCRVKLSAYNIERQRARVLELIYGK